MVPSVEGICVFTATLFAHVKAFHSGLLSVVGKGLDDRVARATISTVDERIVKPSVGGSHHLFMATLTDRYIGRYEDKTFAFL
jgi:hypothetical protein